MKDFYEELKEHFRTTSKEQILIEWNKSKAYDKVGVSCEEFLKMAKKYNSCKKRE